MEPVPSNGQKVNGQNGSKSPVIRAATNEWALLSYRVVTSGCALLMTWWVFDLKTATQDMRKDFTASVLANEARISKVEGQVSVIDTAIRMQTRNIETHESVLQTLWSRIYDINTRIPKGPQ